MILRERVEAAYEKARSDLLAHRTVDGHWVGELASSSLATATAVSALCLVRRSHASSADSFPDATLTPLIDAGLEWILARQNKDGGWGDTSKSYSNISTTMLVLAALHLAERADEQRDAVQRADEYVEAKGGINGLRRRYGKDKTFAVPILTNCALAGIVPWSEVSPLPFEAACLPQKLYRFMRMPVVSYAIPALVAIGQARYFHQKPWNPVTRLLRAISVLPSLEVLRRMQPESGGYLEAIPLTSFVVMALAGTKRAGHPVVQNGLEFLVSTVRDDGSWPIDTNLATWNTTLSINALASAGEDIAGLLEPKCLDWLLACQNREVHPYTGAEPGGWGWSDLSGAVPDADDTPGAMLALANWSESVSCRVSDRSRIDEAIQCGAKWLLDLQNSNGGWPTFCRGWGKLPFDRSGTDLTAHVLRALNGHKLREIDRGFDYLASQQRSDGCWVPLWFGNQDHKQEENPVYGTAKVLLAYRDYDRLDTPEAQQGLNWLKRAQNADGGWGGGPAMVECGRDPNLLKRNANGVCSNDALDTPLASRLNEGSACGGPSSVEETALAVDVLLAAGQDSALQSTIDKGLEWLCCKVEADIHHETSPIGFYFAKLWYHERLYPLIFTVSALGQAVRRSHPTPDPKPTIAYRTQASEVSKTSEV